MYAQKETSKRRVSKDTYVEKEVGNVNKVEHKKANNFSALFHYLNNFMIMDLALCIPGIVKSLAIMTGQLN